VLEATISYNPPEQNYINVPEKILKKYTGRYLLNPIQVMDIENKSNSLQVHLSDFLPNSGFRFQSDLFPVSKNVFNTKISGVQIIFPDFEEDKPGRVILDWIGTEQLLNRTSLDYKTAFENISKGAVGTGCDILYNQKDLFLTKYPDLERILNGLGYTHLRSNDLGAAIQIFRLNVDLFPESANVYDSYGEALMVNDQIDLSIQNYKKSLELNPGNKNAEQVLKKLESK
jgi:tetratricopeptide (TPR) repeat protein